MNDNEIKWTGEMVAALFMIASKVIVLAAAIKVLFYL
jgi:hypothetical protein